MIEPIVRALLPFALVVSAAMVAKGYSDVGDGFAAGATAGLAATLQLVTLERACAAKLVGARWAWPLVVGGLWLALLVALGPLALDLPPVTHFPRPGGRVATVGVLELHTAVLFDLGVAVAVYGAFVGTFDRLFPAAELEEAP